MGFMAGFGSAFSRQIELGEERRAQQKSDAFKLKYADFINRRDYLQELEREDAKVVKKAQALVERTKADPKTIGWVIEQVKGDADDSSIEAALLTGKFDFTQKGGETQAAPIDQQMQESGMAPAEAPEAPVAPEAPAPVNTELLHASPKNPATKVKLSDKLREAAAAMEQRRSQRLDEYATNEVAANAGVSPEDVQGTIAGDNVSLPSDQYSAEGIKFTPAPTEREPSKFNTTTETGIELAKARRSGDQERIAEAELMDNAAKAAETQTLMIKAKADHQKMGGLATVWGKDGNYKTTIPIVRQPDGSAVDRQGNPIDGVAFELSEREYALMDKANTTLAKPLQENAQRKAQMKGALRSYSMMSDAVKKSDGKVLDDYTSGIFKSAVKGVNDAMAFADQSLKFLRGGQELDESTIASLRNQEKWLESSGVTDLASQKALFDTQRTLFAYDLARLYEQSGQAGGEKDIQRFLAATSPGTGQVDTFYQNMSNILMSAGRTIDDSMTEVIQSNPDLKALDAEFGYIPANYQYIPLMKELKNDKEYGVYIQELEQAAGPATGTPGVKTTPTPATDSGTPSGMTYNGEMTLDGRPIYRDANGNPVVRKK